MHQKHSKVLERSCAEFHCGSCRKKRVGMTNCDDMGVVGVCSLLCPQVLHTFCCQQVPEAAGGKKFKLVAGGLGPNPLQLDSTASLEELGVSGSMLSMTWL